MFIKVGFIKFKDNIDDIYLLPTLAIAKCKNKNTGKAYGIGIKFLKLTFALSFLFPKTEPPKDNGD